MTRTAPLEPLEIAGIRDEVEVREPLGWRPWLTIAVAVLVAASAIVVAALDTTSRVGPGQVLSASLVAVWALCAAFVVRRRPNELLGQVMLKIGVFGLLAVLGAVLMGRSGSADLAAALRAVGVALLPAAATYVALSLPDGSLRTRVARVVAGLVYAASGVLAVYLYAERPELPTGAIVGLLVVDAVVAIAAFVARAHRAPLTARPRFQWLAWGVTVALAIAVVAAILNAIVDWPETVLAISVGATVLVPLSLAIGASESAVRIDRLLVHTIVLAGLIGLVGASYLVVVLGLGRSPSDDERSVIGLSMLAAALAALLWVPARERLTDFATRRVYGERHAPDEVIRTFGSRLTRALPLDELLLQLAESLKKTMSLDSAEVWTRNPGGRLERTASVPDLGSETLELGREEEPVVARAGVSGPAWIRVWMPSFIGRGSGDEIMRVAPVTNSGELLGLLVVRRLEGATPFEERDDEALTDLARQVGLALHNAKLDSALQESLEEVQHQADELRASRARIVEAGDAQRRSIERDLHDGAQQHLVALAVSVRLARQLAERDPAQAQTMLDQIGTDLQEAVQELRNLAHGIYPPLLADRGLPDALSAAAGRAALPTDVEAVGVGRYDQPIEAAVYFCCLEALQNAGKHAGEGASATVTIREEAGALLFEVADTGAGFALDSGAARGHGFINMADRVGAMGGTLSVDSAPGQGTRISGRIPL
jgi:signal transduction histidine kinase